MNENLTANFPVSPTVPYIYYKGVLASKPSCILYYQNNELVILHPKEQFKLQMPAQFALEFIEELLNNLPEPEFSESPKDSQHFKYGLLGYFSFEFGLHLLNLPITNKKKADIPDFYFFLPTEIQILDETTFSPLHTYNILHEPYLSPTPQAHLTKSTEPNLDSSKFKSNLTKSQYLKQLDKIKTLLTNGETYQINFAQRWQGTTTKSANQIFRELAELNPSPHQAILQTPDFSIISNSPESLFLKTDDTLSTFPIKGTVPKSENPEILLKSKKDQAELEMIVDLARNDLGKLAIPASVKVPRHRYLESYSNVHHTLSEITCKLPKKTKFSEIINSLFPGGSVTGCPKVRSTKFIHELEPDLRQYYCGSLGYFDKQGNAQFNILIRSILNKAHHAYFHSGGAITIQSNPSSEFEETLHKAENIIKVLSS